MAPCASAPAVVEVADIQAHGYLVRRNYRRSTVPAVTRVCRNRGGNGVRIGVDHGGHFPLCVENRRGDVAAERHGIGEGHEVPDSCAVGGVVHLNGRGSVGRGERDVARHGRVPQRGDVVPVAAQ